jgi:hypothetical protein
MHFRSSLAVTLIVLIDCCCLAQEFPNDQKSAVEAPLVEDHQPTAAKKFPSRGNPLLDPLQVQQIEMLAQQLGSHQFAQRERAATALMQWGAPAIGVLKQIQKSTSDPEVCDRVEALVRQMTDADTQSKIDRFLAGESVRFEGWIRYRDIMGDSITARELFVELHLEHPGLLDALDSDPKEVALAMEAVNAKVQHQMFVQRRHPTQADTIALVLPAFHKDVPILPGYETTIIGVLDRLSAQQIRRDGRLEPGFRSMIGAWISKCTLTNRSESLAKAMQWDATEGLPVAISTLSETDDLQTLVVAMQTIARFGSKDDAVELADLLDDDRVTGETGYSAGQLLQSQIRDVAIATIAILNDVPLAEVGFPHASTHATFGFTILGIGYAQNQSEIRKKHLQQVEAMISPQPRAGS